MGLRTESLHDLRRDLAFGLRAFRRSPGFTVAVVLTLALGIGAVTAVFSVVNATLLRPLPFRAPDRLFALRNVFEPPPPGYTKRYLDFTDWQARQDVFASVAVFETGGANLNVGDRSSRLTIAQVTTNGFSTLGIPPLIGRPFLPGDAALGSEQVTLLSWGVWKGEFGGDSSILGRAVTIQGIPWTVVGIMPRSFSYPPGTDAWVPLVPGSFAHWDMFRTARVEVVVGRLADGLTVSQAEQRAAAFESEYSKAHPPVIPVASMELSPLRTTLVGDSRLPLLICFCAMITVLLIACANTGGLLLARSISRQHEVALRAILGATRSRLVRQFLAEGAVLALSGGLFGAILYSIVVRLVSGLLPPTMIGVVTVSLDARVLLFGVVTTTCAVFFFGLTPALHASRPELIGWMQRSGLRGGRRGAARARSVLAVIQMALALPLLVVSGLLLRSLWQLERLDPGFRPESVVAANVALPDARYSTFAEVNRFYSRTIERLDAIPGVDGAAAVNFLPLSDEPTVAFSFAIVGDAPPASDANRPFAEHLVVTPDYFRTMGIALLRGRTFTINDDSLAPPVIVISRSMANQYWARREPLGAQIKTAGRPGRTTFTVIGVVGDVLDSSLSATGENQAAQMYTPYAQDGTPYATLVVHAARGASKLGHGIRQAMADVDPSIPPYRVRSMNSVVAASIAPRRLTTTLITIVGSLALLLAAIGIYGVVAHGVEKRAQEFAVRVALGASSRRVIMLVMETAAGVLGAGVLIGIGAAWGATRLLRHLLYFVTAFDPSIVTVSVVIMLTVGLVAAFIPARRIIGMDPGKALRSD